jgi:xanthine dehydrogenase small subunit
VPTTPPAHRPIRFYFQGRITEVNDAPATRSVLDWLREDRRCTGSKEGCNEGDCGACMVMVADLPVDPAASAADLLPAALGEAAATPAIRLRAMNACLMFLPTLDGKALYTVEDLQHGAALHPGQQALVDCHGSQCGFCTPGFAVSLAAFHATRCAPNDAPTNPPQGRAAPAALRQQLADALAGNLCRCTGYRPILDAGERMFTLPAARPLVDRAALAAALTTLAQDAPLHYAAPAVGQPPAAAPDNFHAPRSSAELAALRAARPGIRLLGGATDVGLWVNKGFKALGDIAYIGRAADLGRIEAVPAADEQPATLRIGAAVSLEDAWRALAGHWPELTEVWRRFASPPVRHAGTLVGNLANGSPIGDTPPVAIALGASLVLRQGESERRLRLEDFYLDYMKNALAPGEFVSHVELPLPSNAATQGERTLLRAWKISKRYDSDISALCAGLWLQLGGDGKVADVRLAFGGMAATVRRASRAEAALRGQPWSEASVRAAMAALPDDYAPLTDLRATRDYRLKVAANLLWRLWLERGTPALDASRTQVWVARGLLTPAAVGA